MNVGFVTKATVGGYLTVKFVNANFYFYDLVLVGVLCSRVWVGGLGCNSFFNFKFQDEIAKSAAL